MAAPALTAAVKFLGAAVGALLAEGALTTGSLVVGPASDAAGLEFGLPVGAVGA